MALASHGTGPANPRPLPGSAPLTAPPPSRSRGCRRGRGEGNGKRPEPEEGRGRSRRRGAAGAGQRPAYEAAEFAPAACLEAVREECGEKEELRRKPIMTVLVIGLGGVTNGGKTTLAKKLKKMLPNCDIIYQDDFFKPESEVETDERGFKLYDVLDALYMDKMVKSIHDWMESTASAGVVAEGPLSRREDLKNTDDVYILIVEGFLLYSYDTRVYQPADTPGYFDGHVWPMYLKYKNELEENASNIVYLDGTKSQDELLSFVYCDIIQELEKLKEGSK